MKRYVQARRSTKLTRFHQFFEEWAKIPEKYVEKLRKYKVHEILGAECKLKIISHYCGILQREIIILLLTDLKQERFGLI